MQDLNNPLLLFSALQAKKQRLYHFQFLVPVDHGIIFNRLRDQLPSDNFTQFILDYFPGDRLQDVALYFLLVDNIQTLESCATSWDTITIDTAIEEISRVRDSNSAYPVSSKLYFISSLQAYEVLFLLPSNKLSESIVNANNFLSKWQYHIRSILCNRALTDLATLSLN